MNGILLTCSSRKIHIINCLKKSLKKIKSKNKLFLSDSNSEVISRYFSNNFWKSPVLKKSNFNKILRFLLRNNIKIIFPSADSELLFWSNYKDILKKKKIVELKFDFSFEVFMILFPKFFISKLL